MKIKPITKAKANPILAVIAACMAKVGSTMSAQRVKSETTYKMPKMKTLNTKRLLINRKVIISIHKIVLPVFVVNIISY